MNKIPIVFSTDNNYVMQTGVAILSLLQQAEKVLYSIYILINDDVTIESKTKLRQQVAAFIGHDINFIPVGNEFDGAFEIREISVAAYSRLLIPWLLPQYDKVIYSDVDVIFKINLKTIFDENIEEYYISAVPALGAIKDFSQYVLEMGLDPHNYYNSGFLVINCKKQREENLKDQFIKESKKKYTYQDQDIINIVCQNKIKRISPRYCITPGLYQLCTTPDDILSSFYGSGTAIKQYLSGENCILHYAGTKPWTAFCYAWRYWWDVYRESDFYTPEFELEISNRIMNPRYSWRKLISMIKQKFLAIFRNRKK